jgi:hypothetical protein
MLAAAFSPLSKRRPLKTTPCAPSIPSLLAMASPRPWVPPVMIAMVDRFLRKKSSLMSFEEFHAGGSGSTV